jgi:hypothetical protein
MEEGDKEAFSWGEEKQQNVLPIKGWLLSVEVEVLAAAAAAEALLVQPIVSPTAWRERGDGGGERCCCC